MMIEVVDDQSNKYIPDYLRSHLKVFSSSKSFFFPNKFVLFELPRKEIQIKLLHCSLSIK